ncbi:hypothetical protein KM043_017813 [Ampulex compressa]|nr:hypothetical protein KM043_017813 [Ampulex compressa]
MEIPLPAQLFQGRGVLNKFIRHLTVIKDTRHAKVRVIAIVLSSPLTAARRLVFIILRVGPFGKGGEKKKSGEIENEEADAAAEDDREIPMTAAVLVSSNVGSPGGARRRVPGGQDEVKRLPARGVDG